MSTHRAGRRAGSVAAFGNAGVDSETAAEDQWSFHVTIDEAASPEPYTGRLYVLFSQRFPEPRSGPAWFNTEPFLALDVEDLAPAESVTIDPADEARAHVSA